MLKLPKDACLPLAKRRARRRSPRDNLRAPTPCASIALMLWADAVCRVCKTPISAKKSHKFLVWQEYPRALMRRTWAHAIRDILTSSAQTPA